MEWRCSGCAGKDKKSSALKDKIRAVRAVHKELKSRAAGFMESSKAVLSPFVSPESLAKLTVGGDAVLKDAVPLTIGSSESYIQAKLRPYQVDGVNWILKQYSLGTGGMYAAALDLATSASPRLARASAALADPGVAGSAVWATRWASARRSKRSPSSPDSRRRGFPGRTSS